MELGSHLLGYVWTVPMIVCTSSALPPLLVLSGFVLEVVDGFHEQGDAEQSTVVVFKQQTRVKGNRCNDSTCHQCRSVFPLVKRARLLWGSRHHHLCQGFVGFLPVTIGRPETTKKQAQPHLTSLFSSSASGLWWRNSLWYHHQQSDQVLRIKDKVFLLHNISQAPCQQAPPGGAQQYYNNMEETWSFLAF